MKMGQKTGRGGGGRRARRRKEGAEGEDGERGGGKSARRRKESAKEAKAEQGGGEWVVDRAALGGAGSELRSRWGKMGSVVVYWGQK